ncbi:MAG: Asp/Glu racemase [Marivibrio sp.]|uniref:maleate cis-trans isomerase family protein n=1 Tax=Marivibrio sp. TaxID=2039719 RepID=UPI0032EC6BB2
MADSDIVEEIDTPQLAYQSVERPARAALGLIVLQSDETVDPDFRRLIPFEDVRVYPSRVRCRDEVTLESLPEMRETLPEAAALLPDAADLRAIGYGCTSASAVMGEEAVADLFERVWPGVPSTNPLTALKAACRTLGIERLAIVSPYVPDVSAALIRRLRAAGVEVPAVASFGEKAERVVARIAPASVRDAVLEIGAEADCDAVFASCTNLRAYEVLETAERALGRPVLCSNQVLAWHMMRLAGLDDPIPGAGRLAAARLA